MTRLTTQRPPRPIRRHTAAVLAGGLGVALAACGGGSSSSQGSSVASSPAPKITLQGVQHIVVIYQENWSFDSLYGKFPGANGLTQAGALTQVGKDGAPLTSLPQPLTDTSAPAKADKNFPATLPVAWYDAAKYVPADGKTGDIVHRFYQEQYQIDGGKNDRFVAGSDNPGLVPSYYDATPMAEGRLAADNVLFDNFFHSAFGGSFLNHQWLICACTPQWDASAGPVPASKVTKLDAAGLPTQDGFLTTDGKSVINTAYTVNQPHPKAMDAADKKGQLVPPLTAPTIGDRLSERGVKWKWYPGGWNDAMAGSPDTNFQFHHQPFAYYARYADNTAAKKAHLADESDFIHDIRNGDLPAVSFVKPLGDDNEHPGYANLAEGQAHVAGLVSAVENDPSLRDNTVIFITYDENGGRLDHVTPPTVDQWGPGVRVPAIAIAPFVRHHFVDHAQNETVSILAFIEKRWNIQPLGTRDAKANPMLEAFDFAS